ncbi:hypothetical protein LUZ60_017496 [Juncus effusus]|nr:hypothetical protein LUZ60_017496 [Juncus effusus]
MVRPKPSSSKKPKRGGVDFKKFKRKIGRKLPPPKNATNTEVKYKAIVLPEQSMLSERTGMAVNKKGLTLRELLQQTSHHNAKVRKAALNGIRDLIVKHPSELKLHKHAILEKLRERICDADKVVRETLYGLFKSVIFPSLKEDITGPTVTLLMAYILNAMTHISIEIRLTAFKFFELLVLTHPSSFFMHSDKVLDHYMDILRNNQIYLQDKSRLNSILGGLVHCLSLLSENKDIATNNNQNESNAQKRLLHAYRPTSQDSSAQSIVHSSKIDKLENLIPILVNCFEQSMSVFSSTRDSTAGELFEVLLSAFQCINFGSKVLVQNGNLDKLKIMRSLRKIWDAFPFGKKNSFVDNNKGGDERFYILNIKITEVFLELSRDSVGPTSYLTDKFLNFIQKSLVEKGNKEQKEKNLGSLLIYIPKLVLQATQNWSEPLLEAFTRAFKECKVDSNSRLILSYLSAIEEMLLPETRVDFSILVNYQIFWIRELPKILLKLGEKNPAVTKVVLRILLRVGQTSVQSSPISTEYDSTQLQLSEFFRGSFVKLPRECQELAVSCLYYFSSLNPEFLKSLTCSCLCRELDPVILFKIMEIMQSAYKAGRMSIFDNLGFLLTLIARFRVHPENFNMNEKDSEASSNWTTYKSLINTVSTYLSQMGDGSLILNLLWAPISDEISKQPKLPNMYGLIRTVVSLDARISKQTDEEMKDLAGWIFGYVVTSSVHLPKRTDRTAKLENNNNQNYKFLMRPCIYLFHGCDNLLSFVLDLFTPFVMGENDDDRFAIEPLRKVRIIISFLIILYDDSRARASLSSSCEGSIKGLVRSMKDLLESNKLNMTFDEKQELQVEFDRLETRASLKDI